MIADYEGAIVVEAMNYGYSSKNNPKAWCLHTPEELADDYPATPYYFHNTNVGASTTYFVSYLGFVFQCVPESEGAYANGRQGIYNYFDWEDPNVNLNLQTLSIEIEGYAHNIAQTMPRGSAQWNALINLMADRCIALGIPPERTFGHYQVSNQRSDPGTLNIQAVIEDVKARIKELTNDMPSLIQQTGSPSVYLTNWMEKWHVPNTTVLNELKTSLGIDNIIKVSPEVMKRIKTSVDDAALARGVVWAIDTGNINSVLKKGDTSFKVDNPLKGLADAAAIATLSTKLDEILSAIAAINTAGLLSEDDIKAIFDDKLAQLKIQYP